MKQSNVFRSTIAHWHISFPSDDERIERFAKDRDINWHYRKIEATALFHLIAFAGFCSVTKSGRAPPA